MNVSQYTLDVEVKALYRAHSYCVCVLYHSIFLKDSLYIFAGLFDCGLLISSEHLSFVGEVFVGLTSNHGMTRYCLACFCNMATVCTVARHN